MNVNVDVNENLNASACHALSFACASPVLARADGDTRYIPMF